MFRFRSRAHFCHYGCNTLGPLSLLPLALLRGGRVQIDGHIRTDGRETPPIPARARERIGEPHSTLTLLPTAFVFISFQENQKVYNLIRDSYGIFVSLFLFLITPFVFRDRDGRFFSVLLLKYYSVGRVRRPLHSVTWSKM